MLGCSSQVLRPDRNNTKQNSLKFIEFSTPISYVQPAINKKQKDFLLPDHKLAEKFILVYGFY